MTDPLLVIPSGGWTVDDLDALPESHHRYELTDGALTVSPSRSSLHQFVAARLGVRLEAAAPEPLAVTQAVEIRFGRQLTRIPDVLVVRSDQPGRHWFAPSEVCCWPWRSRLGWARRGPYRARARPLSPNGGEYRVDGGAEEVQPVG